MLDTTKNTKNPKTANADLERAIQTNNDSKTLLQLSISAINLHDSQNTVSVFNLPAENDTPRTLKFLEQ